MREEFVVLELTEQGTRLQPLVSFSVLIRNLTGVATFPVLRLLVHRSLKGLLARLCPNVVVTE